MAAVSKSERVLVTGANGFVGMSLSAALVAKGIAVRLAVRDVQTSCEIERKIAAITP